MTADTVTVPTVWRLIVIWPEALTATVTGVPDDAAAPNTSATLRDWPSPLAT